jgi:hypothetical protein
MRIRNRSIVSTIGLRVRYLRQLDVSGPSTAANYEARSDRARRLRLAPPATVAGMAAGRVDLWLFPIAGRDQANRRLRELLGERLAVDPAEVPIIAAGEKPALDPAADLTDLRFNLSHSGERALIAIAAGIEVGVDIERVTETRAPEYLRDWTRREAYLKGTGRGLRGGPRQIVVAADAEGRLGVIDHGKRAAGWRVFDLDLGEGYVGALAAGSEIDVRLRLDPALPQGG